MPKCCVLRGLKATPRPTTRHLANARVRAYEKGRACTALPSNFNLGNQTLVLGDGFFLYFSVLEFLEELITGRFGLNDLPIHYDFSNTTNKSVDAATAAIYWAATSSATGFGTTILFQTDLISSGRVLVFGKEGFDIKARLMLPLNCGSVLRIFAVVDRVADFDVFDLLL